MPDFGRDEFAFRCENRDPYLRGGNVSESDDAVFLTAFVGRSFLDVDELLWLEIRKILESLRPIGFRFQDANEAQPTPISKKVQRGIEQNDLYIGILTRRFPISDWKRPFLGFWRSSAKQRWGTTAWVVQESGYALGKGKRVLLLIENGVDFPKSDLDADRERIIFNRDSVPSCSVRLTAMVANLIKDRLPAVSTASPGLQTSEPPIESPPKEESAAATETPTFAQVRELLDADEFARADEVFQEFEVAYETDVDIPKGWLRRFYLKEKAIRGDKSSLGALIELTEKEPEDPSVWLQLSEYYRTLDLNNEAAKILIRGTTKVLPESRSRLLRSAAKARALDKDFNASHQLLREALRDGTNMSQQKLTFNTLADLAKEQKDRDLEAAALERILELDPTDKTIRFRVAFLYGETSRNGLEIYHYRLRLNQGTDSAALNNLGIALNQFGCHSSGIDCLLEAIADSPLAKANLSQAYIDRGFFVEGERFAREALTAAPENENDRAQAMASSGIDRIVKQRAEEKEREAEGVAEAKHEAGFRARYAHAFMSEPSGEQLNGTFVTPHGRISLVQEESNLRGEFEEGAFGRAIAATLKTSTAVRILLRGTVHGQAGTFETYSIGAESGAAALLAPKKLKGLFVMRPDGHAVEFAEQGEKAIQIYDAKQIEPNSKSRV